MYKDSKRTCIAIVLLIKPFVWWRSRRRRRRGLLKLPNRDSSDGEESQSESNDVESDSESDQERIIQQESSKPCP